MHNKLVYNTQKSWKKKKMNDETQFLFSISILYRCVNIAICCFIFYFVIETNIMLTFQHLLLWCLLLLDSSTLIWNNRVMTPANNCGPPSKSQIVTKQNIFLRPRCWETLVKLVSSRSYKPWAIKWTYPNFPEQLSHNVECRYPGRRGEGGPCQTITCGRDTYNQVRSASS